MKQKKRICMIQIIGIVIGIILFLWFFVPFLVAGILNIGNITGMFVAGLWIGCMIGMPMIQQWFFQKKMKPLKYIFVLIISSIMILAVTETGCMIGACKKTPAQNATAVVLGCRVYGERASLSMVERLEAAYTYLIEHPETTCVVSGGQGSGENISEAECMKRWLINKGIAEERIYKEEQSTSTAENIAFSKEVIYENGLNEEIAIVTSEYHMYRAGMLAKQQDLTYGAVAGKTARWLLPTFYVRELYAILAEWIF